LPEVVDPVEDVVVVAPVDVAPVVETVVPVVVTEVVVDPVVVPIRFEEVDWKATHWPS
jgi:hypothetical protein